jgi:hypothetical protein
MIAEKVYIAGPMSGYPEWNFPAFNSMAKALRHVGFQVVNPAELNEGLQDNWKACMIEDIRQLMTCDSIFMLKGWEKSKGASLEHHIAKELGLEIYYERN